MKEKINNLLIEDNKPIIRQLLREALLTKSDKDIRIVSDFINFAKKHLGITDDIRVALAFERTPDIKTTAYYRLDGFIKVNCKERALSDCLKSIAHELTHALQNQDGRITDPINDTKTGSPLEDEANLMAGRLVRLYGEKHPEIYG